MTMPSKSKKSKQMPKKTAAPGNNTTKPKQNDKTIQKTDEL